MTTHQPTHEPLTLTFAVSPTVTFTGTYGTLVVSRATGEVEEYQPALDESPDYATIVRVDVEELWRWLNGPFEARVGEWPATFTRSALAQGSRADILVVGYWSTDGSYTPAEPDAREELIRAVLAQYSPDTPLS